MLPPIRYNLFRSQRSFPFTRQRWTLQRVSDQLRLATILDLPAYSVSNSFDCYAPATVANAKLVQVTWNCSRQILGNKANTESVQSAKIAIRNH